MLLGVISDVLTPIAFIVWAVVFGVTVILHRKTLNNLRLTKGDAILEVNSPEAKQLVEKTVKATEENLNENIKDVVYEALSKSLYYGFYMFNTEAFAMASSWIVEHLRQERDKEIQLDIKMTVVGMAFSWSGFVDKVPSWLEEHQKCKIKLEILLVDPDFLKNLPIAKAPKDWETESRRRIQDIENMIEPLSIQQKKRLFCEVRTYKALPQYHGILINGQELFLGRTSWKFDKDSNSNPELTVGQNRYRYFNRGTTLGHDRGSERVELFTAWHRFYWEHFSKLILESKDGSLKVTNSLNTVVIDSRDVEHPMP